MLPPPSRTGAGPLYTVAIPVHNKAAHLARCFESVFAQTETRFEVIAVDDASTDGSAEILARMSEPRLRVLDRVVPGPGGYAARNLIIAEARAPWIAFLDADDEWLPDHLAQIEAARVVARDDVGCLFAGYDDLQESGERHCDRFSRLHAGYGPQYLDLRAFLEAWLQIRDCPTWTSATVVRTDILRAIDGFPADRCIRGGDKDTWLRVMAQGDAVFTGHVGAVYHREATNRVARSMPTDREHCLCATVRKLLATEARPEIRRLLRRLANLEILEYAKQITRTRRLRRIVFRGFYVSDGPATYAGILALWLSPAMRRLTVLRRLAALMRPGRNATERTGGP